MGIPFLDRSADSRPPTTIVSLLEEQAHIRGEQTAVTAPDRQALSYAGLVEQIRSVVSALNGLGLTRGGRVALVLENGPEMATAFCAVASGMTAAPLNPTYRESEFDFYLSDLDARALIINSGADSPARAVAEQRGIRVVELEPLPGAAAGIFTLHPGSAAPVAEPVFAAPDDVALVLHTSGTTSRPKIVPLTQTNLCASAASIQRTLRLTPDDRCLNVMPLFHIHGLMAALLSSLAAGGSVVCTPGFYAPSFFDWMEQHRPTWYTAVPTMHQSILDRAGASHTVIAQTPLRFIRSSSSALPPQVMAALEDAFSAPVIEAYGMTEASHQIASNPLPPAARKPGSVGVATGPQVAIMDAGGRFLSAGTTGEIVLKGPSITQGYENNPQANQEAFTQGWFRTGDQGYLDDDGYLFITGRIKEIINRGGQKISPREVDEVLLDHPLIVQAVTFAVPHSRLGEDVGAAIVLREGAQLSEAQIREFASARLAYYKVPHVIRLVNEIPKGPTGKVQRIGLATKLGITASEAEAAPLEAGYTAPRTPLEEAIAAVWQEVLKVEPISIHDSFIVLGGDSMLAAQVVARLCDEMQVDLKLIHFLETPTVAEMAVKITGLQAAQLPDDDLLELLAGLEDSDEAEADGSF